MKKRVLIVLSFAMFMSGTLMFQSNRVEAKKKPFEFLRVYSAVHADGSVACPLGSGQCNP